jgi:hypothetical protein
MKAPSPLASYSMPDGGKTLTAAPSTGDAAVDPAREFLKAQQRLVKEVFCPAPPHSPAPPPPPPR